MTSRTEKRASARYLSQSAQENVSLPQIVTEEVHEKVHHHHHSRRKRASVIFHKIFGEKHGDREENPRQNIGMQEHSNSVLVPTPIVVASSHSESSSRTERSRLRHSFSAHPSHHHDRSRAPNQSLLSTNPNPQVLTQALTVGSRNPTGPTRTKSISSLPMVLTTGNRNSYSRRNSLNVFHKDPSNRSHQIKSYEYYMAKAGTDDLNDIKEHNILYEAGRDFANRPIVVLIGAHFPLKTLDLDRVLAYCIKLMDPIVEQEYIMVYIHTNLSAENKPSLGWLKKLYSILGRKYKKNMKQLYLVQPSFWLRTFLACFKPFLSSKFWSKIKYITDIKQLGKYMSIQQLELPEDTLRAVQSSNHANNENLIFGQPIEEVLRLEYNQGLSIPIIVHDAVTALIKQGMKLEGLFRLSGNQSKVEAIKKLYDSGKPVDLEIRDPHVIAGVLKLYLRELPEPLFTTDLYMEFIEDYDEKDEEKTKKALLETLPKLPPTHRALLKTLLMLFAKISADEENKMTSSNLAICISPNLFRSSCENPEIMLKHSPICSALFKLMIDDAATMIQVL
eukprot:TRINITY_DN4706_c0_g1_i2.p1 TRINITY_DN4706_c0_g1~~TRINITY_DN4706_c0_g1_i2.p1  ORF type:complete len:562 (+),score=95.43 TRINITY_DN4706_c0_g1_i2:42-1727(+)